MEKRTAINLLIAGTGILPGIILEVRLLTVLGLFFQETLYKYCIKLRHLFAVLGTVGATTVYEKGIPGWLLLIKMLTRNYRVLKLASAKDAERFSLITRTDDMSLYGQPFQQSTDQPGMVTNPAGGRLNDEYFPPCLR